MTLLAAGLALVLFGAVDVLVGAFTVGLPHAIDEVWRTTAAALALVAFAPFLAATAGLAVRCGKSRPRRAALAGACLALPIALYAALTLTEGPAVRRTLAAAGGLAPLLHVLCRLAVGVVVTGAAALHGALLARPLGRTWRVVRGGLLAGAAAAVHVGVLPGLYPAFHFGLMAGAIAGAAEAASALCGTSQVRGGRVLMFVAICSLPGVWLFATDGPTRAAAARRLPMNGALWQSAATLLPTWITEDVGAARPRIVPWRAEVLQRSLAGLRSAGLPDRPSFLLMTIDAVRADKTGAAGGTSGYTPRLDALAAGGWSCTRAYAPAALTFPTVAAMMRGIAPDRVALLPDPDAVPRLAEVFAAAGYRTHAGFPAEAVFFGKEIGKDFSRGDLGFRDVDTRTVSDDERVSRLFAFLEADRETPFFAWVHLMGPHAPYTPLKGARFGSRPSELYLAEVAEADQRLGAVVDRLAAGGLLSRTILCVGSDHGEAFGERGTYFHGLSVYDEEVRVPLVLTGPGLGPSRIDAAVSLIDLMPTFLHLAGLDSAAYFGGRSIAPVADRSEDGLDRAALIVHRHPTAGAAWKAAVRPPWKAIKNERTGAVELFHLERDPGERSPLSRPWPAEAADVIELLNVPPIPAAETGGDAARRKAEVEAAAKFGRPDDPRWDALLGDPSSVVRTAAADAVAALESGAGDDRLRRFALADGPATEAERLRALSLVNRRPRWSDLEHEDDRFRYSVAAAAAKDVESRLGAPPFDTIRRRIADEQNPNVLCELLLALDRDQRYGDQAIFERVAARDDGAGARAASLLALRRLGAAGLKRPGETVVDRNDIVVRMVEEATAEVEVPAISAAQLAAGPPLIWIIFALPGRDGKEVEPYVRRGAEAWPFTSHVIEFGCLMALRPTTEPLQVRVVGAKVRPDFLCALFIGPPER